MLIQSHPAGEPTPTMAGPCWDRIDENVFCPLCDYNLRGLIEPRCPECGFKFAWPDLLDPSRRRHPYLFEHHPERNIWSAWKTSWGMLRPRTFWKSLHPSQPSKPRRMVYYWLITVVSILALMLGCGVWITVREARIQAAQNVSYRAQESAYLSSPAGQADATKIVGRFGSIPAYLNMNYSTSPNYSMWAQVVLGRMILESPLLVVVFVWPWLTVMSLMVFAISMQRRKVRITHVMRTAFYSQDVAPLFAIPFCVFPMLEISSVTPILLLPKAAAIGGLAVCFFLYRMTMAYKYYLQFDHPFSTILASQIITALASMILLMPLLWL